MRHSSPETKVLVKVIMPSRLGSSTGQKVITFWPKLVREPSHGRVAASVPELLTRGTQYLTLKMTSKAFGRTTRPSFYAFVQKYNVLVKFTSLTGSSSHEEFNRPGTFWRNPTTATPTVGRLGNTPTPWDDSIEMFFRGLPWQSFHSQAHVIYLFVNFSERPFFG